MTSERDPESEAVQPLGSTRAARIPVALPGREHDIIVGPGLLDALDELVPWPAQARRAVLVTNATVGRLYAEQVGAALDRADLEIGRVDVPDGESAKSPEVLTMLWHRFAAFGLGRGDLVIALGGGVVGDLAGFAAATWHRGIHWVVLPTTLLAQCDAAIGGKTGTNLPEGKNLVGAFHQPLAVVADTSTLATVAHRHRVAGLGEVAKYGFIDDPQVLELLETRPADAVAGDPELLAEVVRRGAAVKARVVAADEREAGERALLNYGHTIGHAIEAATGYERYLHGEAVALGMVAAARLGERLGISEPGLAERTVRLLGPLSLPTGGVHLEPGGLRELVARDKKARGSSLRFVLCERPGTARVVDDVSPGAVDAVVASLNE